MFFCRGAFVVVLIPNKALLEEKKRLFKGKGAAHFHIVADFDKTFTTAFVEGKKSNTTFAQIREGSALEKEYHKKADVLYKKFYPFEVGLNFPLEERKAKLAEWWKGHLDLLVKYRLTRKVMYACIDEGKMRIRSGAPEFFSFAAKRKIPLVILSSGLGDIIVYFLKKHGLFTKNVNVIANFFKFGKAGKVVGYNKFVIHSLIKDEADLKSRPFYKKIAHRKNVLLFGDSIGDLEMVAGIEGINVISVGFLNDAVEENLQEYKKKFDIIVLEDGSFEFVNDLLKELFGE